MKPFPDRGQLAIFRAKLGFVEDFPKALANKPFVPLAAGVEGDSAGWVARDDAQVAPAGPDDFLVPIATHQDVGRIVCTTVGWWRIRIDSRKVPKHLVEIAIEQKEKLRGRKLSKREKREVRDAVAAEVLPTLPTTTKFVHVLASSDTFLLCSSSKAVRELCVRLIADTWPASAVSAVEWGDLGEGAPHPVANLIAANALPMHGHETSVEPRPGACANFQAVIDGPVTVENADRDRIALTGDTVPVLTDAFMEAVFRDRFLIRKFAGTAAAREPGREIVVGFTLDAVAGSLAWNLTPALASGNVDAEDRNSERIDLLWLLARVWQQLVERSTDEALVRDVNRWFDQAARAVTSWSSEDEAGDEAHEGQPE